MILVIFLIQPCVCLFFPRLDSLISGFTCNPLCPLSLHAEPAHLNTNHEGFYNSGDFPETLYHASFVQFLKCTCLRIKKKFIFTVTWGILHKTSYNQCIKKCFIWILVSFSSVFIFIMDSKYFQICFLTVFFLSLSRDCSSGGLPHPSGSLLLCPISTLLLVTVKKSWYHKKVNKVH